MPDTELTHTTRDGVKQGTVIVTFSGPFTLNNMFGVQNELRAMRPDCLILDMTGVPYMDSAGLGVVMNCYVSAQDAGRKFFLAGVNERIGALLQMTRVDKVLPLCATIESAEALA